MGRVEVAPVLVSSIKMGVSFISMSVVRVRRVPMRCILVLRWWPAECS